MKKKDIIVIFICIFLITVSTASVQGFIDKKEIDNIDNNEYSNKINQLTEHEFILTDEWFEQAKLLASDGDFADSFGWSVAMDDDYAIIGAWGDDDNGGEQAGSAYIFKRDGNTWSEQAKLIASDGEESDTFGWSVSIDGNYSIIGAYADDDNGEASGSAYIFKRDGNTWSEQAKLIASDGEEYDTFGKSVSIFDGYAFVGAPYDDSCGSVYIFTLAGSIWTEQSKLVSSDGEGGDMFGVSVFNDDNTAFIGAFWDNDQGNKSGSVYVFERNGTIWTEKQKLNPSDGAEGDWFGRSVSISGDYAIVGSEYDDDNGEDSGSAYIFKNNGINWYEEAKILASDGSTNDLFGISVSIDNEYAAIGALGDDVNGYLSGSAYIFKNNGTNWTEESKLLPSDGESMDFFGVSVSNDGNYALIGAFWDDDNGEASGSAYIFSNFIVPIPNLDCSGDLDWTEVTPSETVYGSIIVDNIGDPDSLLDWEMESYPDWGTWSFDPVSGFDLLAGDSVTIDVEVVAPDEEDSTFTGEVVLVNIENSYDKCVVDVSLVTPVNKPIFSFVFPLLHKILECLPNLFPFIRFLFS